jgi:hypothetical protein
MCYRPTIHEIKRAVADKQPYFFSRATMKFFNQRLSDFSIYKQDDGRWLISAPMRDRNGNLMGYTRRFFNPAVNDLETE